MDIVRQVGMLEILAGRWRARQLTRIRAHGAALGAVLACCALGQFVTLAQRPLDIEVPDTATYLSVAHHIATTGLIFDPIRTPGYPAFLALLFAVLGGIHFHAVVYAQAALTVLATLEIYALAFRLAGRRWLAGAIAALLALDVYVNDYERLILTETLAYWLVVTLVLALVWHLRDASRRSLAALAATSVLLVLTRPNFLYLPLLFLLLLAVRSLRLGTLAARWKELALALVAIVAPIGAYMIGNGIATGFYGLSDVPNGDLFGKVLEYHMQGETADPRYAQLAARATAYVASTPPADVTPYNFAILYPQYGEDDFAFLAAFSKSVILHHPAQYAADTVGDILIAWSAMPDFTYLYAPYSYTPGWVNVPIWLSNAEQGAYILLPLALVFSAIRAWRHPEHQTGFVLVALLLAVGAQVVLTGAAVWVDYARLKFPLDWAMILAAALLAADAVAFAAGQRPSALAPD